jgi:hypothetical protein
MQSGSYMMVLPNIAALSFVLRKLAAHATFLLRQV